MCIIPFGKDRRCVCGVCCIFLDNFIFYFLGNEIYMFTLTLPPSPLAKFWVISASFREKFNIFLQIGNQTEKRYPNLCPCEERQKQGLSSYLLCSLYQFAWLCLRPAKNMALPTVVDGQMGKLWVVWGVYDEEIGMWIYGSGDFLRCNGVFLSCIFQNNPWRADYSGFAEVGNSVLIHMIFLNACKSINIWIETKWQFNFVCVYVWWYHANLIDVLEDKKPHKTKTPKHKLTYFRCVWPKL